MEDLRNDGRDDTRSEALDGGTARRIPGGAERPGSGDMQERGEHRTTVEAESERRRAAETTQAEHPDLIAGRGRATGEPPLRATDEDADPRDPTT